MKKLLTIIIIASSLVGLAQNPLSFGNVNELNSSTKAATYTFVNDGAADSIWVYFKLVEQVPFEGFMISLDSAKALFRTGNTVSVDVTFGPKQNMTYNGVLFVETKNSVLETIKLTGQGTFSNTYYSSTQNKSAEDLKTALKSTISAGYVSLGYTTARDNMYGSIDNVGGDVECVYTGTTATFNTRAGANSASFNCEHTYPQGKFSSSEPMKSDIHHLFPTTVSSNSKRGNDPFGVVSNPTWNVGGSKSGGGTFEPRDVHKGTVGRAMSYFVLRHQDYGGFYAGQESILRQWMEIYPPSAQDIKRNNDIYALQKNRNPFVDYPQFLDRISSISGTASDGISDQLGWCSSLENDYLDTIVGDYTIDFALYNQGTEKITIDSIYVKGIKMEIQPSQNKVLNINDIYDFRLRSTAVDQGWVSFIDTIVINTSSTSNPVLIFPLSGVIYTGSSISENHLSSQISIYPNPTKNELNINSELEFKKHEILDLSGRVILNVVGEQTSISLAELPQGNYLLRSTLSTNEVSIKKFQKL
ncbi:MAG: endonuclease [Salibacteraceae bacterium]